MSVGCMKTELIASKRMQFTLLGRNGPEANVRFGSKADIAASSANVRFTPESGHCKRWLTSLAVAAEGPERWSVASDRAKEALTCPLLAPLASNRRSDNRYTFQDQIAEISAQRAQHLRIHIAL